MIGSSSLDKIFHALNDQIGVQGDFSISLVVCGGTALAALGLLTRTTKDADVLGLAEEAKDGLRIVRIEEFPPWLQDAAQKVARDFDLPEDWLNLGPAPQLQSGLPEGFAGRLTRREYGKHLQIYFTSRIDQIHFKLYAAVDRNDYHVQDLFDLNPDDIELERAAKWTLTQDVSEEFRVSLKDFFEKSGYGHVAERI